MDKMKVFVVIAIVTVAGLGLLFLISRQGYTFSEMDWNSDGKTSIDEIFDAVDIRTRKVRVDGKECVEYFRLKDGLPVKTVCG